jgi:hypothetical protein
MKSTAMVAPSGALEAEPRRGGLVVVAIQVRVLRDENSAQVVRFVPERMQPGLGRRIGGRE